MAWHKKRAAYLKLKWRHLCVRQMAREVPELQQTVQLRLSITEHRDKRYNDVQSQYCRHVTNKLKFRVLTPQHSRYLSATQIFSRPQ